MPCGSLRWPTRLHHFPSPRSLRFGMLLSGWASVRFRASLLPSLCSRFLCPLSLTKSGCGSIQSSLPLLPGIYLSSHRPSKFLPGEAYLAGLLHDIGRFVMLEHAAPNLLKVDESNWGTPEELIQADLDIYKFTHSELGYLACKRWSVPDKIASVVREHHKALAGPIKPGSSDALCFCVHMADRLAIAAIEKRIGQDELAKAVAEVIQVSIPRGSPNDLVSAEALLKQIPKIDAESQRLLSGLGFGRA